MKQIEGKPAEQMLTPGHFSQFSPLTVSLGWDTSFPDDSVNPRTSSCGGAAVEMSPYTSDGNNGVTRRYLQHQIFFN